MKIFPSKEKCGLLPYIRKDLAFLSEDLRQQYGWEIRKFNIKDLWNKSDGDGVVVAIIDTGCDPDHIDLKDNILDGKNFVKKGSAPIDGNGHGTHVSGTIAAINNSTGIVGVAPKTKIVPVKSLDDQGQGSLRSIVDGIIWAADQNVDFLTMSLGSPSPSRDLKQAIDYAEKRGVVCFCAAGNSGMRSSIMYPAKYNNTISIGAIDENLNRTEFTCSGEELDFLAPGHNILGCVPNHSYAIMSGTSMSNPFAVGCAALVSSYRKKQRLPKFERYSDYINFFAKTASALSDPLFSGKKQYQGYGIINPYVA